MKNYSFITLLLLFFCFEASAQVNSQKYLQGVEGGKQTAIDIIEDVFASNALTGVRCGTTRPPVTGLDPNSGSEPSSGCTYSKSNAVVDVINSIHYQNTVNFLLQRRDEEVGEMRDYFEGALHGVSLGIIDHDNYPNTSSNL